MENNNGCSEVRKNIEKLYTNITWVNEYLKKEWCKDNWTHILSIHTDTLQGKTRQMEKDTIILEQTVKIRSIGAIENKKKYANIYIYVHV